MSRHHQASNGEDDQTEPEAYGLVCALCERRLKGRFESRAEADLAADDHATNEHPDREQVVVLKARIRRLSDAADEVLERAREKQPSPGERSEDPEEVR